MASQVNGQVTGMCMCTAFLAKLCPGKIRGLDALVSQHVKTVSVTAGAVVYGDLNVLGALPHISNARKSPDQDAILDPWQH